MISTEIQGMDALLKRIDVISEGLPEATVNGMLVAADSSAAAMENRIDEAVTMTGFYRQQMTGGNPGRVLHGHLIGSIRDMDDTPAKVRFSPSGNPEIEAGFWNNPPDYTAAQEFNEYSGDVLLATQSAFDVLASDTRDYVKDEVDDLVDQSARGSYNPRKPTFRPRRTT